MPFYEYVCPQECGYTYETQRFAKIGETLTMPVGRGDTLTAKCPQCRVPIVRCVSLPQVRPTAEPYFNHNVGTWIKDDADLRRQLKRKAAKNSELTGTDHNYQPVYPGDLTDPGTMKKLGIGRGADRGESIEHARRTNPRSRPKTKTKVIT